MKKKYKSNSEYEYNSSKQWQAFISRGYIPITEHEKRYVQTFSEKGWDWNNLTEENKAYIEGEIWLTRQVELDEGEIPQNEKEKHYVEVELPKKRASTEASMKRMDDHIKITKEKMKVFKKEVTKLMRKYGLEDYIPGHKYNNIFIRTIYNICFIFCFIKVGIKLKMDINSIDLLDDPNPDVRLAISFMRKIFKHFYDFYDEEKQNYYPNGFLKEYYKIRQDVGLSVLHDCLNDFFFAYK